jgi:hypothetical protein
MDPLLLLLRLLHVGLGALWVGMAVFTAAFMVPAIEEAGPDGGKVMAALQRRGILTVLPVLALGTLLSGIWLYWRSSAGLQPAFLASGVGLAFGIGGLASLVAYGVGITVLRPSMMRAAALMQGMGSGTAERERQSRMAEARALRARGAAAGRLVAALLLFALAAMAVARYLPAG